MRRERERRCTLEGERYWEIERRRAAVGRRPIHPSPSRAEVRPDVPDGAPVVGDKVVFERVLDRRSQSDAGESVQTPARQECATPPLPSKTSRMASPSRPPTVIDRANAGSPSMRTVNLLSDRSANSDEHEAAPSQTTTIRLTSSLEHRTAQSEEPLPEKSPEMKLFGVSDHPLQVCGIVHLMSTNSSAIADGVAGISVGCSRTTSSEDRRIVS